MTVINLERRTVERLAFELKPLFAENGTVVAFSQSSTDRSSPVSKPTRPTAWAEFIFGPTRRLRLLESEGDQRLLP
jgi:hypothetical protein